MASETPATASQLLEALDQGRCSAEELVRDCLARIEARPAPQQTEEER